MSLLRRRGIAAGRRGAAPSVPDEKPAYFQTDQNVVLAPAVLTDQPGYFQTDQNVGLAPAVLTDQPGYFQTDQNIQE